MPTVAAIIEQAKDVAKSHETRLTKKELAKPTRIPVVLEESLLTGYFQRWQSVFERSTTGAVLDMVMMGSYVTCQCRRCEGSGIMGRLKDIQRVSDVANRVLREAVSNPESASGKIGVLRESIGRIFTDCPECGGTGSKSWLKKDWEVEYSKNAPFEPINGLDVNVKGGQEHFAKVAPDDSILASYAIVSRRLAKLPLSHQLTLSCAFGPEGESWCNSSRGRVWAVTELTEAGALLVASDPMQDVNRGRMERITDIADIEEKSATKNKRRLTLIAKAVMQAGKRLTQAIDAWNAELGEGRR